MKKVIDKFDFKGKIKSVKENKTGLINSTFIVSTCNFKYVLQKINTSIFKKPFELMENIELTADFLKVLGQVSLELVKSKDGDSFIEYNSCYWRAFKYIDSTTYLKADSIFIVSESAKCLGNFHLHLNQFPIEKLNSSIPNFHNTSFILNDFKVMLEVADNSVLIRCDAEIDYILSKEDDCKIIQNLISQNKIPLRVCHNDPKISNFLFDNENNAICLIDLDTVMPGIVLFDIADAIRTSCVSESEEESDLNKVFFKFDYFEEFIKLYLNKNRDNLNKYELQNIVKSIEIIFLEQGIRFLSDYLSFNKYYEVTYPEQNLVRAKNQLHLARQIELNVFSLENILLKYIR
ncbi:MAG: aminoglycoside phosphotransferase family protein [Flavobacteriales bacterium]|nr:aminoglycoside phosphotransferase family protein [Flavobacteriales bacterium]